MHMYFHVCTMYIYMYVCMYNVHVCNTPEVLETGVESLMQERNVLLWTQLRA